MAPRPDPLLFQKPKKKQPSCSLMFMFWKPRKPVGSVETHIAKHEQFGPKIVLVLDSVNTNQLEYEQDVPEEDELSFFEE